MDWSKWILQNSTDEKFFFPFGTPPYYLRVDSDMTASYRGFLEATKFDTLTAKQLSELIINYFQDSNIEREDYDEFLRNIIPITDLNFNDIDGLSHYFNLLFMLQSSGDVLPRSLLISSLVIFTQRKKSEKLMISYKNGFNDKVSFNDMINFLFALILPILLFRCDPTEEIIKKVKEECYAISCLIFDDMKIDEKSYVTFEDFCEWYSLGGYEYSSWLELLDFKKWPKSSKEEEEN